MLETIASYNETLLTSSRGIKCILTNENTNTLRHKRLGHIYKQRIERHVFDEILGFLNSTDFKVYVECIKEKRKNKQKEIRHQ